MVFPTRTGGEHAILTAGSSRKCAVCALEPPADAVTSLRKMKQLKWFVLTLSLVSIGVYAAMAAHGYPRGVDDAHIAFVYASHLADGHGLVYNVGGERVEGFTSLLWVLLTAGVFRLSNSPERDILLLSTVLVALNYTVAIVFLERSFRRLARWCRPAIIGTVYLALLVAWPAHITWMTVSLMDTALWSLLVTGAVVLMLTERHKHYRRWKTTAAFACLLFLMSLTRPESLLLAPCLVALRFGLIAARERALGPALRLSAAPAAVALLTFTALTIFRVSYFGYPLPNTYYAKAPPSVADGVRAGLSYLNSFATSGPLVTVIIFCDLCVLALAATALIRNIRQGTGVDGTRRLLRSGTVILAGVGLVLLGLPVPHGGDHFSWWRMYQPFYPLLLLGLFLLGRDVSLHRRAHASSGSQVVLAIIVVLYGLFRFYDHHTWFKLANGSPVEREFRIAGEGARAGLLLTAAFSSMPELPSVAVITAGAIKRNYAGTVYDLVGLNSVAMGHSTGDRQGIKNHAAFNEQVFFEWAPDILWPVPRPGPDVPQQTQDFVRFVLRGMADSPEFLALYAQAIVRPAGTPDVVVAYFRRDFLEKLRSVPGWRVELAGN